MKYILFTAVIALYTSTVFGVRCHKCSSHKDNWCKNEGFKNPNNRTTKCTDAVGCCNGNGCMYSRDNKGISRGCVPSSMAPITRDRCEQTKARHICYCNAAFCNDKALKSSGPLTYGQLPVIIGCALGTVFIMYKG
ncbi:unnamed protein product [Owenia fusiformis]|uniref:Uncharacterized protein n=1 Tax=Owenia fusiformis TaxID=6347 RepID=A0A8J1UB20_OWEFU|nr:unnamed protein product [Owenia fusiformis]